MTGRLDHIRELGADAILLTPINRAPSYHRYDTTDFRALDPLLGTWDDLAELVRQAHARGLRLVFDVALNHVSRDHPWFRAAAAGGAGARERQYFRFLEDGKYLCWWGYGHMPELQLDHPDLLDELFLGEDSVLAFWLGKGFDGVRLDCANDLTFPLCRRISEAVKARFPDAAVLGEICNYSAPWLDALDGTQSYFFTASLKALWQKSISHGQFQRNMQMAYGGGAYRQFQMLSSHDIPRARTEFATDPAFLRAARRLQFTLPGIPMVYYGEEFGLEGAKDPDNRATVPWETWPARRLEPDARELQELIRLRQASPELRAGRWEPVFTDGVADLVAFFRVLPEDPQRFTLVAWNDASQARPVTLTVPWGWLFSEVELREVFTGRTCQVGAGLITLPLEPRECSVWQINPGNKGSYSFFKSWHLP
ncbi:MAG: hypothetical protein GX442_24845 [Candidatus Riflebacteria bacterium]|nr:hypothetical protein [Candidatus Riflebacteria bacterium]